MGGGLAVTVSFFMISAYFENRLGFANGTAVTVGSLGRIILPQLAVWLQEIYTFTGATLITGI